MTADVDLYWNSLPRRTRIGWTALFWLGLAAAVAGGIYLAVSR